MRVYAVQFDIAWEDKKSNHEKVRQILAKVEPAPGSLVVLPEMFDTGFSLNVEKTRDDLAGESERFCCSLAAELGVFLQGARTTVEEDGWARNRALICNPRGEKIADYAKLHPFGFGREVEKFRGGDELVSFEWMSSGQKLTVSPLICYDLRFPEAFRLATLELGAEMFTLGASWPAARADHWRALLIARAIENQAYVVGVNRCGNDPHLEYAGGSLIISPKGKILAEAGAEPVVLQAEISDISVRAWRNAFSALRDVRREMLGRLPGRGEKWGSKQN